MQAWDSIPDLILSFSPLSLRLKALSFNLFCLFVSLFSGLYLAWHKVSATTSKLPRRLGWPRLFQPLVTESSFLNSCNAFSLLYLKMMYCCIANCITMSTSYPHKLDAKLSRVVDFVCDIIESYLVFIPSSWHRIPKTVRIS